jgi:7-carboxy-7-deazaguanine synthase
VNLKGTLKSMDLQEIFPLLHHQLVILTGGEPLIQQNGLWELIERAPTRTWQFETNGTITPHRNSLHSVKYVVSPKLSNNVADSARRRLRFEPLTYFVTKTSAAFKFVLDMPMEMIEVQDIIHMYRIPVNRVWLMACGTVSQEIDRRASWIIDACKKYGYNYSDRLHIRVYGDKRGT